MNWLHPFIHWGFLLVQLITAILALRCWHKNTSIACRIFIIVWVLTFFTETAGKLMGHYGIHNLWLYNLFNVFFYPGILILYTDVFTARRQRWIIFIAAFVLAGWTIEFLLTHDITLQLNTYYNTVASAAIIFLALAYLVKLFLDKETTTPLRNDFYYWFSLGFIIYFGFNAVMIGMYTKIIESKSLLLSDFTFYANHLITLVLHIFLWKGFWAAFKWMK